MESNGCWFSCRPGNETSFLLIDSHIAHNGLQIPGGKGELCSIHAENPRKKHLRAAFCQKDGHTGHVPEILCYLEGGLWSTTNNHNAGVPRSKKLNDPASLSFFVRHCGYSAKCYGLFRIASE